jgi:hypothetical protein
MAQAADIVFIPCGHIACCESCTAVLMGSTKSCPTCRGRITQHVKTYDEGVPAESSGGGGSGGGGTPKTPIERAVQLTVSTGARLPPTIVLLPGEVKTAPTGEREMQVCVRVSAPETPLTRLPCDVSVALDVSSSMDTDATREDEAGNVIRDGFTVLDIAKHACKVIVALLAKEDRLALTVFSSTEKTRTVLPLTLMDEAGVRAAHASLDALRSGGSTDLWKGLELACDALPCEGGPTRSAAVFILTDGEPNVDPPAAPPPPHSASEDPAPARGAAAAPGPSPQLGASAAAPLSLLDQLASAVQGLVLKLTSSEGGGASDGATSPSPSPPSPTGGSGEGPASAASLPARYASALAAYKAAHPAFTAALRLFGFGCVFSSFSFHCPLVLRFTISPLPSLTPSPPPSFPPRTARRHPTPPPFPPPPQLCP